MKKFQIYMDITYEPKKYIKYSKIYINRHQAEEDYEKLKEQYKDFWFKLNMNTGGYSPKPFRKYFSAFDDGKYDEYHFDISLKRWRERKDGNVRRNHKKRKKD